MDIGNKIIELRDNGTVSDIEKWLSEEAGIRNIEYFGGKYEGGLSIQQNPKEYSLFLDWLRNGNFKNYLEIGVGEGGSFLINALFSRAKSVISIDTLDYGQTQESIEQKINILKNYSDAFFYKKNIDEFLKVCEVFQLPKFDIIFIDADHSYEGVSNDFIKSQQILNEKSPLVLHDIYCFKDYSCCFGVVKLWEKISQNYKVLEFVDKDNPIGIGVLQE